MPPNMGNNMPSTMLAMVPGMRLDAKCLGGGIDRPTKSPYGSHQATRQGRLLGP